MSPGAVVATGAFFRFPVSVTPRAEGRHFAGQDHPRGVKRGKNGKAKRKPSDRNRLEEGRAI